LNVSVGARAATGVGYKNATLAPDRCFLQIAGGLLTAGQLVKIVIRKSRD
jgi:hypothetical protein